ncbi:hypothetical protein ACLKA7_006367 [Drosophila subpalustris]
MQLKRRGSKDVAGTAAAAPQRNAAANEIGKRSGQVKTRRTRGGGDKGRRQFELRDLRERPSRSRSRSCTLHAARCKLQMEMESVGGSQVAFRAKV